MALLDILNSAQSGVAGLLDKIATLGGVIDKNVQSFLGVRATTPAAPATAAPAAPATAAAPAGSLLAPSLSVKALLIIAVVAVVAFGYFRRRR
jgi:hypothetical protein